MRLKSELWVHAYLRRCQAEAIPAQVVRHGDDDAGAIYIKVSRLDGTAALYGPAPAGLDNRDGGRLWAEHAKPGTADHEIEQALSRQVDFDPDVWIVEIEDRQGRHMLEGWLARQASAT